MIRSDERLKLLYAAADLCTLIIIFLLTNLLFRQGQWVSQDYLYLITMSLIWVYLTSQNKVYLLHLHNTLAFRTKTHLKNHLQFAAVLCALQALFGVPVYTVNNFMFLLLAFPAADIIANFLVYKFVGTLRRRGKNIRNALVVGAGRNGLLIDEYFAESPDLGYRIVGFVDDEIKDGHLNSRILGPISKLEEILISSDIHELIIALPTHLNHMIRDVIDKADFCGIRVRLIPDYTYLVGKNYKTTNFGNMPIINVHNISLDKLRLAFLKGVFDFVFSFFVMIILTPLFLVLSLIIKLESPGPVFYCPVRMGKGGRPFKVYKFRSMYDNDSAGKMSTQKNDSRITRVGKVIRKYSLDELPQFLNVLKGDMSVVGPRPHRIFLNNILQKEVDGYMIRHYLKPGITGWAQVNGWRGPTDTHEQKTSRTAHDLWYVENWTPLLDVKIVYLTLFGEKTFKTAF